MTELLTESFCERCGTRFAFGEPPKKPARLGRLKLLSRGLKSYVLSDEASLADALVEAKTEDERRTIRRQLESFQNTFNFCLDCRQYVCTDCWNDPVGRCVECAPRPGAAMPAAVVEPVAEPVVLWAAAAEPELEPEPEPDVFVPVAAVEVDPWVGVVWAPEPEPEPALEAIVPELESPSAFALDATEPATSADAVLDFGPEPAIEPVLEADAAVELEAEFVAEVGVEFEAEFEAQAEPDLAPELDVAEALPPELEVVAAAPDVEAEVVDVEPTFVDPWRGSAAPVPPAPVVPFRTDAPAAERGSLLGRVGARRPQHDHVPAVDPDVTPEDRLRDLFNQAEGLSDVVPAPEPAQRTLDPEAELEPEPVAMQAAPEPDPLPEAITEPAPVPIVEAAPIPVAPVAPPPPPAPASAPAEVWWIVAPEGDPRRDQVAQPIWNSPPARVVPPPAAFVSSHVPTTGPVPAQNVGVWVTSSRDVLSRPGTGVQVCVKCALPLSASARFCRRCGSHQV